MRGGKRANAGRKSKSEEQALAEKLKPYAPKAFKALDTGLRMNEPWAVKIFFEYMYGKPIQRVETDITIEKPVVILDDVR